MLLHFSALITKKSGHSTCM